MKYSIIIMCLCLISCTAMPPANNVNDKQAAMLNTKLALAYLQQGNITRAKTKILSALQEDSDNPIILDAMGYFLEKTGDRQLAEHYYIRAVQLAPNQGAIHNNYGTYLCRAGRYREAISQFLLAVKDMNYLHIANAYENAGLCAQKIPDKKLVQKYFRAAAQHGPGKFS